MALITLECRYNYIINFKRNTIRVKLWIKWGYVGVRISTPAEVLAPWRAPTELSATPAELYAQTWDAQLPVL